MSDEANSTEAFDLEDRPAAGTACVRCKRDGHFCGAKGYAGEDALCLPCGTGQACAQRVAVVRLAEHRGWDEGEIDPRGLHGACRTVAIEDAEENAVGAVAGKADSSWQRFKQTLSVENLKGGPRKVRKVEAKKIPLEKQRDAGRRRRMNEVMESRNAAPKLNRDDGYVELCGRGCGKSVHRGSCVGGQRTEAGKTAKRVAAVETIAVEEVPREPIDELISKLVTLATGSAIRFSAESSIAANKAVKAAIAACTEIPGELKTKRVDATAYFWFE